MSQSPCVLRQYLSLYVPPGSPRIEFEVDGWRFVAERSSTLGSPADGGEAECYLTSDYWHIGGVDDATAKLHITVHVPDESIAESWLIGPEFTAVIRERLVFVRAMMQVDHPVVRDELRRSLSSIRSWADFHRQKKRARSMVPGEVISRKIQHRGRR
jgi:hypothetical protein